MDTIVTTAVCPLLGGVHVLRALVDTARCTLAVRLVVRTLTLADLCTVVTKAFSVLFIMQVMIAVVEDWE